MLIDFVSLKFSPGLLKEVLCLESCVANSGFGVRVFLARKYKNMLSENELNTRYILAGGVYGALQGAISIGLKKSSAVVVYNSHPFIPLLFFVAMLFRWNKKRVFVCHEPMKEKPFKHYGSYGWVVLLIEFLNKVTSWLATDVVVLSPRGKKLFQESIGYSRLATLREARILLPPLEPNQFERRFFTFLGNVVATKKLDWFLHLAEKAFKSGVEMEFLVVSSSELPDEEIRKLQKTGVRITVINPKPLTDAEISRWLFQSKAVLSMHRSVTQSGVFVECMRHGTPVICLNEEGFSQFILNSGILVDSPYNSEEMLAAAEKAEENLSDMSAAALSIFHSQFSSKNFEKYYGFLNN